MTEVERDRRVAGDVFFKNGQTPLDWRRTASMTAGQSICNMVMEDFRWFEALFVSWKGIMSEGRERARAVDVEVGGLDINFHRLPVYEGAAHLFPFLRRTRFTSMKEINGPRVIVFILAVIGPRNSILHIYIMMIGSF